MTPDELKRRVDAVIAQADDDEDEKAHEMEDRLHRDVMMAFCPGWVWSEIVRLDNADFARWYS